MAHYHSDDRSSKDEYDHDPHSSSQYAHQQPYYGTGNKGDLASNAYAQEPLSEVSSADDYKDIDPNSGVKRGLKTRHLSMMALAGIIGPGLLIGSGGALKNGGPASLIIGFGVIGIIAFSIMQSLGELTTLYPTGGAFTHLADRFVDKAFGAATGWNYFIIWWVFLELWRSKRRSRRRRGRRRRSRKDGERRLGCFCRFWG